MVGFVCAPQTGFYTFWISSDDNSELWLWPDSFSNDSILIASVPGHTAIRQWDKYATQQSDSIFLQRGTAYKILALQKEGTGVDHLSVGWKLPDETLERPIPGSRLIPWDKWDFNELPQVTLLKPVTGQTFAAPATIEIEASAIDVDGEVLWVEFYAGGMLLDQVDTPPYTYIWTNVPAGTYEVTAIAVDDFFTYSQPAQAAIFVGESAACNTTGTITFEQWHNVAGLTVDAIPLESQPATTGTINSFEMPSNSGDHYGTRVRGYLCPPVTGNYTFYLASDDHSELWLSNNETPDGKMRIAHVYGHTYKYQWNRYPSQTSVSIALEQGKPYYIEVLHKEATGGDHLAVGWQLPDGTLQRPIDGAHLAPFAGWDNPQTVSPPPTMEVTAVSSDRLEIFPNPVDQGPLTVAIPISEATPAAQSIHIEIISMIGETIFTQDIRCGSGCAAVEIDPGHIPPGTYMVSTVLGKRRYAARLIVIR